MIAKFIDRPGRWDFVDLLNREPFIKSLIPALVTTDDAEGNDLPRRYSTGFVVGLTGPWGSGKSTILNRLEHHLTTMGRTVCFHFNPWLFKGREELLLAFMRGLTFACKGIDEKYSTTLADQIDKYWEVFLEGGAAISFGNLASVVSPPPKRFTKLVQRMTSLIRGDEPSLTAAKSSLEKSIKDSGCAIVVLIDELDRVEDEEIRTVAQLIKAVGDIEGISYLVAYDADRVIEALGRGDGNERRRVGRLYIEKIIQYSIPLRPLFSADVDQLVDHFLVDAGVEMPEVANSSEAQILEIIKRQIETPREVKRLIASFRVLKAAVAGEISSYDVLGYCWILAKNPDAHAEIVRNVDQLVVDPAWDLMARGAFPHDGREQRASVRAGMETSIHARLIDELFDGNQDPERAAGGNRINLRRNLVRLLYLGDPPGAISLKSIYELISGGTVEEIVDTLNSYPPLHLANFIDRLADGANVIPEAGSLLFWRAVARFLATSPATLPGSGRDVIGDFAQILMNIGIRDRKRVGEVLTILEDLIENEADLTVAPEIIRKHIFAHGLAEDEPARGGETVLSSDQVRGLLVSELPRYAQVLRDGEAIKGLRSLEPLFVIYNFGVWDESLRAEFSSALRQPEVMQHFAKLVTPPGVVISPTAISEILDGDVVMPAIIDARQWSDPHSLEEISLFRLQAVVLGHDLTGLNRRELEDIVTGGDGQIGQ